MRKTKILAFLFIGLSSFVKAEILLTDSFENGALDSSKWDVFLPNGNSSVSVQDGYLKAINRGTLISKNEFNSPYKISGSFRTQNLYYDLTTITLRSSGLLPSGVSWGLVEGIAIEIWSDGYYITPYQFGANAGSPTEYRPSVPIYDNVPYNFQIIDTGNTFSVIINDQLIFTEATTFTTGGKIAFSSRESWTNNGETTNGHSDLLAIQIESVPEPSALSLLAVGLGGLAMMRRRRP